MPSYTFVIHNGPILIMLRYMMRYLGIVIVRGDLVVDEDEKRKK